MLEYSPFFGFLIIVWFRGKIILCLQKSYALNEFESEKKFRFCFTFFLETFNTCWEDLYIFIKKVPNGPTLILTYKPVNTRKKIYKNLFRWSYFSHQFPLLFSNSFQLFFFYLHNLFSLSSSSSLFSLIIISFLSHQHNPFSLSSS